MHRELVSIALGDHQNESTSGILLAPDAFSGEKGVILAHGAGNDMHLPLLEHLAQGLARAGYVTLRFNFLYREKGKLAMDREEVLRMAWAGAWRFLSNHPTHAPARMAAAGKSLGARTAALMAADGEIPAERLVYLGYPLHPPGKKDKIRDAHLYRITAPMLFFEGTRDPFCDLGLLRAVLARFNTPFALEIIEGGDHSFNVPARLGVTPDEVLSRMTARTTEWLSDWI